MIYERYFIIISNRVIFTIPMKYNKTEIAKFVNDKDPLVEFVKPKQTARSSPFWSSFIQVFYNKVKQDAIQCETCKSILIYRSIDGTRVMSNHIKSCKQKKQLNLNQENASDNIRSKNSTNKQNLLHIKKLVTDACVEFASLDNRSFATVNGDGFMKLIESVFVAGRQLSGVSNVRVNELIPNPTTVIR